MLTLKLITEETERVVKGLEKKHFPNAREAVEKVLEYDKIRRAAMAQIKDKHYDEALRGEDRCDILAYGIAFCRKRCRVVGEKL